MTQVCESRGTLAPLIVLRPAGWPFHGHTSFDLLSVGKVRETPSDASGVHEPFAKVRPT